ncbi:hypothetical protein GR198_19250 [Rhizobium leguminosarum]|uniref:hypothetical protein n=1 Tax=Rhizobium leguminosarum TaxID=384 RepID=UPI0013BED9F5|nr:hypothetical protein [Rhizobium leguminosarum]NEH57871.1 hypothetical protein [Rhizobium leguminosarum]
MPAANLCQPQSSLGAALSGDPSILRLEDMGEGQARQFAMTKAFASSDERYAETGLETDIGRLEWLRAGHDDQYAVRRHIHEAEREIETATRRIAGPSSNSKMNSTGLAREGYRQRLEACQRRLAS